MRSFDELGPQEKQIIIKMHNKGWVGKHQAAPEGVDSLVRSATGSMDEDEISLARDKLDKLEEEKIVTTYNHRDTKRINSDWYSENVDDIKQFRTEQKGLDRIERP